MKLTRVYADDQGRISFPPNSYGKDRGIWYIRPPGCHLGSLELHTVEEHEDGTITASPSILQHDYEMGPDGKKNIEVHGHLIRGEWSDC